MHIRKDDTVMVVTGKDRGTRSRVLLVDTTTNKVVVEGVNRVFKHMKRSQRNPKGGRLSKEMPVAISNVMVICSACGKPTRTGSRYKADGSKFRYCKSCDAELGQIAPARSAYAEK